MARRTWTIIGLVLLGGCGSDPSPVRIPPPRPYLCSSVSSGCACSTTTVGDGTATCDPASVVKQSGQQGYCCKSEFVCQCRLKECAYRASQPSCQCGNPQDMPDAVRVNDCNQAMAGLICCLNSFGCMCGTTACGDPSESVPNCTIADVTRCDGLEQTAASCTEP